MSVLEIRETTLCSRAICTLSASLVKRLMSSPWGMPVEIGQRQLLQLVKQVPAQAVGPLLGQCGHNGGLAVGGRDAAQIDDQQF